MKYIRSILPLLLIAITSCSPVYLCGDPVPEKLVGTRRLLDVVADRDYICTELSQSEAENLKLNGEIKAHNTLNTDLNEKNKTLQQQYSSLIDENLSMSDQYNKALKARTEELEEKERLLSEREMTLAEMKRMIEKQDSITSRLNYILKNALLGFNADELSVDIRNGKVYVSMSDKLLFKSGSVAVESKGREALKLLADVLNKNTDIDVLIEGHTDNVPIKTAVYKDNWDLSVGRATSIIRILTVDYSMSPQRLTASGKGEFFPRADNSTEAGRAMNRRTEIILSPKLDELMQIISGS